MRKINIPRPSLISLSLCVFRRRTLCADTSAQIRYGICNSTSYALNCLCHSFLSDLPLFCSLQLPDHISTITEGVLFFLEGAGAWPTPSLLTPINRGVTPLFSSCGACRYYRQQGHSLRGQPLLLRPLLAPVVSSENISAMAPLHSDNTR